ncbi:chitin synthase-domain-containing protein [Mycena polygramma]|nr:chitin synthase-domain-containing protein [Mycena polygramma]
MTPRVAEHSEDLGAAESADSAGLIGIGGGIVGNGLTADQPVRQKIGLWNLFTIRKLDTRKSTKCISSMYLLLTLSIIMVSVIGFQFLASISLADVRAPKDHNKFAICQVPCYTEGDAARRKTIDLLAQPKYNDKHNLSLMICDGMIIGPATTARPRLLSFLSLGGGMKQHNMGKVYSAL